MITIIAVFGKRNMAQDIKNKIPLWQHQQRAIDIARERDYYALFFEQGTGKTATAINILRHWCAEHSIILRTLVLCPQVVCDNWLREFGVHAAANLVKQVQILDQSGLKRAKLLHEGLRSGDKKIFITTTDAPRMRDFWKEVLKYEWQALIVDESHRYKGNTLRTRGLFALTKPNRIVPVYGRLERNVNGRAAA